MLPHFSLSHPKQSKGAVERAVLGRALRVSFNYGYDGRTRSYFGIAKQFSDGTARERAEEEEVGKQQMFTRHHRTEQ